MLPIVIFVLIQIFHNQQVFGDLESDQNSLDKFIDQIEDNEHNIHHGIASGRYADEDKKEDKHEDNDDDDYGKLLLDDMMNFRRVKIPGVDYDMEPVAVPVAVNVAQPVYVEEEEEEEGAEEAPTPQPNQAEDPNISKANDEAISDRSVSLEPSQPPPPPPIEETTNANNYQNSDPDAPTSIQDSLSHSDRRFPADNSGPNHYMNQQTQATIAETEPPLPINSYHETLKYDENVFPDQISYENYSPQRSNPLPPISHSSYQDSADAQNAYRNNQNENLQNGEHLTDKNYKGDHSHTTNNDQYNNIPNNTNIHQSLHNSNNDQNLVQQHYYPNNAQQSEYDPNSDPNQDPQQLQYNPNQDPQQLQYNPNQDPQQSQYDPNQDLQQSQYDPNQDSQQSQYDTNQDPQQSQYDTNQDPQQSQYDTNQDPQQSQYDTNQDPQQSQYDPNQALQQSQYDPNQTLQQSQYDPNQSLQQSQYDPNQDSQQPQYDPNQALQQSQYDPNQAQQQSQYDPNQALQQSQYDPNQALQQSQYDPNQTLQQSQYDPNQDSQQSQYDPNQAQQQSQYDRSEQLNYAPNLNIYQKNVDPNQNYRNPSQTLYSDQNIVTSEVPTELVSTQVSSESNKNNFEDYKNTNEAQIVDENKQISKRMGHSTNDDSGGHYYPRVYQSPKRNRNKPSVGSRVYSKTQEYTSYLPNNRESLQPNQEDLSQDEPQSYYDRWAEEQIKMAEEEKLKQSDERKNQDSAPNYDQSNAEHDLSRIRKPNDYRERNQNNYMPNSYSQEEQTPQHDVEQTPQHEVEPIQHEVEPIQHNYNPTPYSNEPQSPQTENNDQQYNPFEGHYIPNIVNFQENKDNNHNDHNHNNPNNPNNPNLNSDEPTVKPNEEFQYDFPNKESFDTKVTTGQFGTFPQLPFNFESLIQSDTSFLDALTPQNLSAMVANNPDYDQNNNDELTSQNPNQFRGSDESNTQSSPPTYNDYDQQNYEPQRNVHHPHQLHNHNIENIDSTHNRNNYPNRDYLHSKHYHQQNTGPNHHTYGHQQSPQYEPNENPYQSQEQYEHPVAPLHISRSRNRYSEDITAATVSVPKKVIPKSGNLYSDESRKVFTQTNTTNKSNKTNIKPNKTKITNPTHLHKTIDPLILKSKIIIVDDKNVTQYQTFGVNEGNRNKPNHKNLNKNLNKNNQKKLILNSVEVNKNIVQNVTQIPKTFSQIRPKMLLSNNLNKRNKLNHFLKPNLNTSVIPSSQHSVRTVRTRPQRSVRSIILTFPGKPIVKSNLNAFLQKYQNTYKDIFPKRADSQKNQNLDTNERPLKDKKESSNPKCAEKSFIKNICFGYDEDYPHESISKSLVKNFETLSAKYGKMNSTYVNLNVENGSNSLTNACPTHDITIYPLRAKNINGEWKLIVNVGNVFNQKIALSKCSREHKECKLIPQLSSSACIQMYSSHYFMVYNMQTLQFDIDLFRIPTVCSCYIMKRSHII